MAQETLAQALERAPSRTRQLQDTRPSTVTRRICGMYIVDGEIDGMFNLDICTLARKALAHLLMASEHNARATHPKYAKGAAFARLLSFFALTRI